MRDQCNKQTSLKKREDGEPSDSDRDIRTRKEEIEVQKRLIRREGNTDRLKVGGVEGDTGGCGPPGPQ